MVWITSGHFFPSFSVSYLMLKLVDLGLLPLVSHIYHVFITWFQRGTSCYFHWPFMKSFYVSSLRGKTIYQTCHAKSTLHVKLHIMHISDSAVSGIANLIVFLHWELLLLRSSGAELHHMSTPTQWKFASLEIEEMLLLANQNAASITGKDFVLRSSFF